MVKTRVLDVGGKIWAGSIDLGVINVNASIEVPPHPLGICLFQDPQWIPETIDISKL